MFQDDLEVNHLIVKVLGKCFVKKYLQRRTLAK